MNANSVQKVVCGVKMIGFCAIFIQRGMRYPFAGPSAAGGYPLLQY